MIFDISVLLGSFSVGWDATRELEMARKFRNTALEKRAFFISVSLQNGSTGSPSSPCQRMMV